MFIKKINIAFPAKDKIMLRGWFYLPDEKTFPVPCVIMTHGFTALKEHYLAPFAEAFVNAGMAVLIYDHRGFGESDGEPRYEVNPLQQVEDMISAIDYLETKPEISKIALWGTSLSGGHVLKVAAEDRRVHCVVAQVPFVQGHHEYLKKNKPDVWKVLQKKYLLDKKSPALIPVVTDDPHKTVVMKEAEAYEFFTSIPQWENKVTLHSMEVTGEYKPIDFVQHIKVPVLMIVVSDDTICPAKLAEKAFDRITAPKKIIHLEGHHFSVYAELREQCIREAVEWLDLQEAKCSFPPRSAGEG